MSETQTNTQVPVNPGPDEVTEALIQQFKQEFNGDLNFNQTDFLHRRKYNQTTQAEERYFALQQKYGLIPAQIGLAELQLAKRFAGSDYRELNPKRKGKHRGNGNQRRANSGRERV